VQQKLAQAPPEFFNTQIALNQSAVTNRNLPGFLGNHNGNRIGFLAKSQARAMAKPEIAIQILPLREGKNARRCNNTVVSNNHSTVVEDGFRVKNREHEFF